MLWSGMISGEVTCGICGPRPEARCGAGVSCAASTAATKMAAVKSRWSFAETFMSLLLTEKFRVPSGIHSELGTWYSELLLEPETHVQLQNARIASAVHGTEAGNVDNTSGVHRQITRRTRREHAVRERSKHTVLRRVGRRKIQRGVDTRELGVIEHVECVAAHRDFRRALAAAELEALLQRDVEVVDPRTGQEILTGFQAQAADLRRGKGGRVDAVVRIVRAGVGIHARHHRDLGTFRVRSGDVLVADAADAVARRERSSGLLANEAGDLPAVDQRRHELALALVRDAVDIVDSETLAAVVAGRSIQRGARKRIHAERVSIARRVGHVPA